MNKTTVDLFLQQNEKELFPSKEFTQYDIESILLKSADLTEGVLNVISFRKSSTLLLISIFGGLFGIDRFYLGETGKGIAKLILNSFLPIWWIVDIITAKDRCRTYNCRRIVETVNNPMNMVQNGGNDIQIENAMNYAKNIAPAVGDLRRAVKDFNNSLGPF